jgi:homoserine dehydrogenase
MTHYNLALLGFGNVGQSLAQLLLDKRDELRDKYQLTYSITAIGTRSHGMVINTDGLDIEAAIRLAVNGSDLSTLSTKCRPKNVFDLIRQCKADVLFENTPVNYQSGEPAISHLTFALEQDMHIITANKGPVVHAYSFLAKMAETKGRKFYFESTVMDGAPIFSLFREALPAAQLFAFHGILNSTTNMILTRMENGESFDQAVTYCQKIGIAETDPSGDIDGWDAAVKVAALVTVLMGIHLNPADIQRKGIREITIDQIQNARLEGKRWKLICSAEKKNGRVMAKVWPKLIGPESPMYAAAGTTSMVVFETDILAGLSIVEQDPGPQTTAYGLLADFLNAVKP